MLAKRIIRAFTWRRAVYAEVKEDREFTTTAWLLVIVVGFLNQLGANASRDLSNWLVGSLVGTIYVVIGFALSALVIQWVSRRLFKARVTFGQLVRTLGLAYIWQIGGAIGVLTAFSPALAWYAAPAVFFTLALIAWFVAAKEVLQLPWPKTVAALIVASIPVAAMAYALAAVLGLLGATAGFVWGLPLSAGRLWFPIAIVPLIWAVWTGLVPMLRLGFRRWVPLVLLYTLWIGSFWGFVILRIYLPPEHALAAAVLAVVLLVLYFSYPLLQGVAAHITYASEMGGVPSWRSAFLKSKDRYARMLLVFSLIMSVYATVVFSVYAAFGDGWAEYFQVREASLMTKFDVLWEGLIAGFTFSPFVDMFPPIIFPFGVFVGLANPSSEFFFAMVVASLVAVGILFVPMLWFIFWLPRVTLRENGSLFASLVDVLKAALWRVVGREIVAVLRSFVLWLALVIAAFLWFAFASPETGVSVSLGRWVAPAEFWGWTPVALGLFPGLISVILQHERVRLYVRLFGGS